jgi:hypothetical protein
MRLKSPVLRESEAWKSVKYHSQTKGGLAFGAAPEAGKSVKTFTPRPKDHPRSHL